MHRVILLLAPLCGLAFLLGCATAPPPPLPADDIVVRVTNDLVPPVAITVFITPEGGVPQRMGDVDAAATETLSFDAASIPKGYRLVAERPDGTRIVSELFFLERPAFFLWHVRDNHLERDGSSE